MKTHSSFLILLSIGACMAQSTISPTQRYAYCANAGWIDFHADGTNGVIVTETYLAGKAYAANFGWIDFGDGTPANGHTYSNSTAADYGVNLSRTGALSGFAYSANIGWIQFEHTEGQPALAFLSGKFSGYAHSANAGWISLDNSQSDLVAASLNCPDFDQDGIADAYEWHHFHSLGLINETSDNDKDGHSDLSEYLASTDPKDSNDFLKILSQTYNSTHTQVSLHFTSQPNRLYRIEHNTDLCPAWQNANLGSPPPPAPAQSPILSFSV